MASFFDDPDDIEEEYEGPPTPLFWRIVGKFFKYFFWAIIIVINGLILWRMFSSGDPAVMRTVRGNEALAEAYADYEAQKKAYDALKSEYAILDRKGIEHDPLPELTPFGINQSEHTIITDEAGKNYGYFCLTDRVIFPYAGQVQFVFRYNDSTLDALVRDYGLDFEPDKKQDWYDVSLRVLIDRTPDDSSDNDDIDTFEVLRLFPTKDTVSTEKNLYSYRQFSFEGLPEMLEGVTAVYVDVYYKDDINYKKTPYGQLTLYLAEYEDDAYKLDRKDVAAIRRAAKD